MDESTTFMSTSEYPYESVSIAFNTAVQCQRVFFLSFVSLDPQIRIKNDEREINYFQAFVNTCYVSVCVI